MPTIRRRAKRQATAEFLAEIELAARPRGTHSTTISINYRPDPIPQPVSHHPSVTPEPDTPALATALPWLLTVHYTAPTDPEDDQP